MTRKAATCALSLLAIVIAAAMTGCVGINIVTPNNTVEGSGPAVSKTYETGSYDAVDIGGGFEVVYSQSETSQATIEIQENLLEHITVKTEGSRLKVEWDGNLITTNGKSPKLTLSTPTLREISCYGGVTMTEADQIAGDSFRLEIAGGGLIDLDLDVEKFDLDISGAGAVTLNGRAATAEILITGAGSCQAFGLETQDATVDITGAGTGEITAENTLDASITGAGSLEYKGNPTLTKDIVGVGSVRKAD
ncbi:MAG: head GIN domain-containing protein [Oscillospiraceae bacterium]